jgi:hypothetical protein
MGLLVYMTLATQAAEAATKTAQATQVSQE